MQNEYYALIDMALACIATTQMKFCAVCIYAEWNSAQFANTQNEMLHYLQIRGMTLSPICEY